MIISIINLIKGGVGKTTIATNLAGYFSNFYDVKMYDLDDEQEASYTWCLQNDIKCVLSPAPKDFKRAFEDKGTIHIFDTGGYDVAESQALLAKSDMVLLPTSLSAIEIKSFVKLVEKIEKVRQTLKSDKLNLYVVPNRIVPNLNESNIKFTFSTLEDWGFKVTPALRYKVEYQKAYGRGESVYDSKNPSVRTEFFKLTEYIKKELKL